MTDDAAIYQCTQCKTFVALKECFTSDRKTLLCTCLACETEDVMLIGDDL